MLKPQSKTHGKFVWYDVITSDTNAADSFYCSVVGWDVKDSGMPDRRYAILSMGSTMIGGLMPIPEDARKAGVRPAWMGYISVDDVDLYAKRVKTAGGVVHRGPEDIPGVGRFAVVGDPDGAGFMLFKGATDQAPTPASAGANCTQATGNAPSASILSCSAGPRPRRWTWDLWASTRLLRSMARNRAG